MNNRQSLTTADRGALWSLKSLLFLVIILAAVAIAAQSIPADTSTERFDTVQQQQLSGDVLAISSETGSLGNATRYWNASEQSWIGAATGINNTHYTALSTQQSHPLWPVINTTLYQRLLSYNIEITYQVDTDTDGQYDEQETIPLVYQGPPGQEAVSSTTTTFIYDSDTPHDGPTSTDGDPCTFSELTASNSSGRNGCSSGAVYAPESAPDSPRYNTVQIKLTVW